MSRGVQLSFRNAEDLFQEAELLREKGHYARAVVLHQLSIEECGKIEIIGGYAMHLLLNGEIDIDAMTLAFRSHKAKNYANSYFTEVAGDELKAHESGDMKAAMEVFTTLQARFHNDSNDTKNAALYVDFKDGTFVSPSDVINAETARRTAAANYHFLALTAPKISMIDNLLKDDGGRKNALIWLTEQIKKMKDETGKDPRAELENILAEMLDRYVKDTGGEKR
jgi:AbiV family abortive infection protein